MTCQFCGSRSDLIETAGSDTCESCATERGWRECWTCRYWSDSSTHSADGKCSDCQHWGR